MEASPHISPASQVPTTEDDPVQCKSFASVTLDAPSSCIEFSRVADGVFVVGTYNLVEAESEGGSQSRNGSLVLMHGDERGLTSLQTHATNSAVLDLHFSPPQPDILAVATSAGAVEIYRLRLDNGVLLERFKTVEVFDSTILVLSLAWHPSPGRSTTLAVSLSDGKLALVDYAGPTALIRVLEAHSLEAWTVSWSPGQPSRDPKDQFSLYSGGDDSALRVFPTILLTDDGEEDGDVAEALSSSKLLDLKTHGAGVTAIMPFYVKIKDRTVKVLLTGSYDEYVRILWEGPSGRLKSIAEKRLGGGVWRLKMLSSGIEVAAEGKHQTVYHVLASCMHAGTRILRVRLGDAEDWSIDVLAKFEEHESMNYGSDATFGWEGGDSNSKNLLVASTSFYDRKLCLWTFPIHANGEMHFDIGRI